MNGSATPLSKTLFLLRTSFRSRIEEECSVACVGSEISWVKLYSKMSSDILLETFWAILKLKSPVIIMSGILVFTGSINTFFHKIKVIYFAVRWFIKATH